MPASSLLLLANLLGAQPSCDVVPYPSLDWYACEIRNSAVSTQNAYAHPEIWPTFAAASFAAQQARFAAVAADPERAPHPNPCATFGVCPVDPRLEGWADGAGLVEPVLYTSRSGATISGHVWATRSGAAKRPGIVIINGSIVGYEEAYWYAAQALAKAGFVVLTFDAQGEGMSDQFGEAPDQLEDAFAGIPILGLFGPTPASPGFGGNGLPFYDGGVDAIDFLVSTPSDPYVPVPSRTTGTSHAAKQDRRVGAGLNSAFNPFWELLDPTEIGLTGHSYGAIATSWVAQQDPRVKAAVAWDTLCLPASPSPDEVEAAYTDPANGRGFYSVPSKCFGAPAGPAPALAKPALGITVDYLATSMHFAPPDRSVKGIASLAYSAAGVDTGNIVIRGGTHLDFTDVPVLVPASLRGIDLVTWYTTAWFAKYLRHDPAADAMLLTTRWRDDAAAGGADLGGDGNVFSWHYDSRLDVSLAAGGRFTCESLRAGCAGQVDAAADGGPPDYSFVGIVTSPDDLP